MNKIPTCSFCGKGHGQAKRLVLVPVDFEHPERREGAICDECVSLNMQILAKEMPDWRDAQIAILQAIEPKNSN
jgi:hypothetical protein